MKKNYDIDSLNPRENIYAKKLKSQIVTNISNEALNCFKEGASSTGIPYQTLINLYLTDCAKSKKEIKN